MPSSAVIPAGSNATVNAIICNSGDCAGDYDAVLMINDAEYDRQALTVNGGEEVPVSFALTSLEAGTYVLALGGQTLEFRVTAEPLPAAFTVASLDVSPAEVDPGEEVSISATVTNTGDMSGICEVVLSIDGEIIETREVTLAGDASREVIFSITPDKSGRQIIEVDGAIGSLEVRGEVPAPEPIPTYAGETESVSEPEIPETVGILPEEPSTNWGLIGGIIAAVVVVIGLAAGYFFWWRKRGVSGQPPAAMS